MQSEAIGGQPDFTELRDVPVGSSSRARSSARVRWPELWRALLVFFSRWWQLETLYRSNMKYQPEWVPRYACYEDARLIPRVGVASVIAEDSWCCRSPRRNKQHTGEHVAAPADLVDSAGCTTTAAHRTSPE